MVSCFFLSTGLETALADVVSQLLEKSKSMVKTNNVTAEDVLEERMAKKLPCLSDSMIPPMKQDDFCKSHCNPMHKTTVGI